MKTNKSETAFKGTIYFVTILFMIVILLPVCLMISYSIKDGNAIYEYPPNLLPHPAKSLTVVLDYSKYAQEDREVLLDRMLKDSTCAMFIPYFHMNKGDIGEIKVFGKINGNNVFYQRAHGMYLRLDIDLGIYNNIPIMNRTTLFDYDRYKRSGVKIGYTFDLFGIKQKYNSKMLGKNHWNKPIRNLLMNESKDRGLNGELLGTAITINNLLLLENYKYYFLTPTYLFPDVPFIAKYSFFAFIFNTLLTIGWGVLCQLVICSLAAFSLSRLLDRRVSNVLMLFFLATMMIPFMCILIPQIILFKDLGMLNTYGAMLLPYLTPFAFYIFLFRGFFDRLPQSLFDAAEIDGASHLYNYRHICMALSKPIISVVTLQIIVSGWGDFFWYYIAAPDTRLWTINVALYQISMKPTTKMNVSLGLSLMMILPVIIMTMIFSKKIKESIVMSGIRG